LQQTTSLHRLTSGLTAGMDNEEYKLHPVYRRGKTRIHLRGAREQAVQRVRCNPRRSR